MMRPVPIFTAAPIAAERRKLLLATNTAYSEQI